MPWHPPTGKHWTRDDIRGMPWAFNTLEMKSWAAPMQLDAIFKALQLVTIAHVAAGDTVAWLDIGTFQRREHTRLYYKVGNWDPGNTGHQPPPGLQFPRRFQYRPFLRPAHALRNTVAGMILP